MVEEPHRADICRDTGDGREDIRDKRMSKSQENGVIRIGRKGRKKFAFGDEGEPGSEPFDVEVVSAWGDWVNTDDNFRPDKDDEEGNRPIASEDMPAYRQAAVDFVKRVSGKAELDITPAEALDFIARLREQYDELAGFFQPKSLEGRVSPGTLEAASEFRFSEEK